MEGQRVLELGCGTAAAGLACAALGASTVWLTDIDDDALAFAARNAALNGLRASVARLDFLAASAPDAAARAASHPPGMPETFDLVLACDVLCTHACIERPASAPRGGGGGGGY